MLQPRFECLFSTTLLHGVVLLLSALFLAPVTNEISQARRCKANR